MLQLLQNVTVENEIKALEKVHPELRILDVTMVSLQGCYRDVTEVLHVLRVL
jgi:hypothetical protein